MIHGGIGFAGISLLLKPGDKCRDDPWSLLRVDLPESLQEGGNNFW